MKRANALSKCPGCNAVANPRWPSCLACGEVLPSLKALAHTVLERNGSRVSTVPEPANDSLGRWDSEMQELTQWFMETGRPQVRRFELCPGVVVLDSEQYWAGLRAIVAGPQKAKIATSILRTELRQLHQLFGRPAVSQAESS